MTKIDVFSGFLGAGKTTLIKKLIREAYAGEKLVLIENEFGEIGIDGGFLQDSGVEVTEMNSGCICCSLTGDFRAAMRQVVDRFAPDRILIEPSGVGKLSFMGCWGWGDHIPKGFPDFDEEAFRQDIRDSIDKYSAGGGYAFAGWPIGQKGEEEAARRAYLIMRDEVYYYGKKVYGYPIDED